MTNKEILEDLFYNKLDIKNTLPEYVKRMYTLNKYGTFLTIKPIKNDTRNR